MLISVFISATSLLLGFAPFLTEKARLAFALGFV
jgi:hypothetical protein